MSADHHLHSTQEQPPDHKTFAGRVTFGFLTANIHIGAGRTVWPGVVDAAEKHGVNLICFPGGELRMSAGFEAQRNVIYDLIDAKRLNGLVTWASTLGGALSPSEVTNFHQRFEPLPMVSLAQVMEKVPTLSIDSYEGMRAAVTHLIEVHGYHRLAFIRGPASHVYAQERYHAYTDVLQDYGLPFLPELVTRPVQWEAGTEAMQMLLDEAQLRPGLDFQAVVAVSDLLALGAMRTLQAQGVQVPRDVAVVGFNDSIEGRLVTPPLTSVALPFYEQGARAVEMLCAQLVGEQLPAQVMLQSKLVVRQSCGCPSQSVAQAAAGSIQTRDGHFAEAFDAIRDAFLMAVAQIGLNADELAQWAEQLLAAFRSDLNGDSPGLFLHTMTDVLDRVVASGGEVVNWQKTISALRRCILPYLDHRPRTQAEDLFGQARVVISEAAQRAQAYRQLQTERQAQALRDIGQALITTFDVDKLADVLAERLPGLGIVSCYLALYENPAVSLEQSRLVLAYSERGRVPLTSGGQLYPSHQLVPENLLPRHRRYSLVVEPLYFREEQIGFVLFEIGPRDSTIYEVLRAHISSALKGALLFHEAQRARLAAEKADQIKTRLLANVSHELRTPLNIILDTTKTALHAADVTPPPSVQNDLQHIQSSAEHQLRVINDLLDLSRAEIDELDLYLELLDAQPLLEEAFHSIADRATTPQDVIWQLQLPDRLPWINADAVRLRQILLNLLSNAGKFTASGHITLGAEVSPPHLHLWVEDTGIGIEPEQQERIFEPFVTAEHDRERRIGGIGLGLSITRHLVALHGGTMALDSQSGGGSTFHIYLPLPRLSDQITHVPEPVHPVLLLISTAAQPAKEIVEFSQRQSLDIQHLSVGDDLEAVLSSVQPAAVAWDLVGAQPGDWAIIRRLRNHPRMSQTPFVLYGQVPPSEDGGPALAMGLTSFVVKSTSGQALLDAINASRPTEIVGPILIVDDDPQARAHYQALITKGLPDHPLRAAVDGAAALTMMSDEVPSLVILDLIMPGLSGLDVLDRMRADPRLRPVPVVILSSKLLNLDDVKRLERHAHVTFHSKGILSEEETIAALNRALFGTDSLPPQTSALVKRAVAYLHQNYAHPLSRWEIAEAIGVNEDYLTRVFSRELGLSPWDYLNRYRINRAKELLSRTDVNIRSIAHQVGFRDQAYFSRVFHKLTGISPNAFREHPEA